MLKKLVSNDLFFFDRHAVNTEELFENVSNLLFNKGLVEETYIDSLKTRESSFPTGLITEFMNIGIPHTDPEHIIEPFVAIVKTEHPIKILQMGDNQEMKSNNFFFLGIRNPKNQVGLLSEIMDYLNNKEFTNYLIGWNVEELLKIIN